MKNVVLVIISLFLCSNIAAAQQKAPISPPCKPKPCPCPKTFQGFFIGGNVGYGVGVAKIQDNLSTVGTYTETRAGIQGFDGGLNAGYLERFGDVSLGIEGVFNWSNIKGKNRTIADGLELLSDKITLTNSLQVRVPIGYVISQLAVPKILLGWQNSQLKKATVGMLPTISSRFNGFLWGGGIDLLLVQNLIGGIEYTGVAFAGRKAGLSDGDTTTISPIYNKFAITLKYILPPLL